MWIDLGHSVVNMDFVTHIHISEESIELQLSENVNPDIRGDHDRITLLCEPGTKEIFDKALEKLKTLA